MTRTDAYDTMQRILNEFGPQETASIMASVLEKRSHSYMTMARETHSPPSKAIIVREAGRASREANTIRSASLDLGGLCGGPVDVTKPVVRKREEALHRAWEAWERRCPLRGCQRLSALEVGPSSGQARHCCDEGRLWRLRPRFS